MLSSLFFFEYLEKVVYILFIDIIIICIGIYAVLYHDDSSLIHYPWVNKPVLGNVPCPKALHLNRRPETGNRPRDARFNDFLWDE